MILLIPCIAGVKHHIKSKSYISNLLLGLFYFYRPEKDTPENKTHNYYVSNIRIRSEHCIGFLKGRWSSLRGLRVNINQENHIIYATLWIVSCIHLHAFAAGHEFGINTSTDSFYHNGIKIMEKEAQKYADWYAEREADAGQIEADREASRDIGLLEGKLKREELKKGLFEFFYSQ